MKWHPPNKAEQRNRAAIENRQRAKRQEKIARRKGAKKDEPPG